MNKIWKWLECNRFLVVGVLLSAIVAINCTLPQVVSPLDPGRLVDSRGLDLEFRQWQADCNVMAIRFKAAGEELTEQIDRNTKLEKLITDIATNAPNPLSWPGLLLSGGGLGAIIDNIRKRGLISGLKIKAKSS
jgi:hypothetical protein